MKKGEPSRLHSISKRGVLASSSASTSSDKNKSLKNSSAVFPDERKPGELSAAVVKQARKSGVLNLSNRSLVEVPSKVWQINILDDHEKSNLTVSLDSSSSDKWWEYVELTKLIIANNFLTCIPSDVSRLEALQVLDVHDNRLDHIAEEIGGLQSLQKLELSRNKLTSLPNGFYMLKTLTELNLNHNQIESLSPDFGNLNCLRVLDLSFNKFTSLPDDFCLLTLLTNLNLSANQLTQLPDDFGNLTGLRCLDVGDNGLKSIPPGIRDLCHLETLCLQKNKISDIPDVSNMKALKELLMQYNSVKVFHSEMFALTRVQLLDFRCNKISTLSINPVDLEFVERLYFDNNDIQQLPNELARLPAVKALTLDGNPLRGVRVDILQRGTHELLKYLKDKLKVSDSPVRGNGTEPNLPGVQPRSPRAAQSADDLGIDPYKIKSTQMLHLVGKSIKVLEDDVFVTAATAKVNNVDLTKNLLNELPGTFEQLCPFLTELKLDNNGFVTLPIAIAKCSRLHYLSFQSNQISALPDEFHQLNELREINFAYNRFTNLPTCLLSLPKLEIFIASSNKINDIPVDKLQGLKRLAVLDLGNNNISTLPPELGLMKQIKSLNVEGNAFRVPSYHLLSQGTDAVMRYLQSRIKE